MSLILWVFKFKPSVTTLLETHSTSIFTLIFFWVLYKWIEQKWHKELELKNETVYSSCERLPVYYRVKCFNGMAGHTILPLFSIGFNACFFYTYPLFDSAFLQRWPFYGASMRLCCGVSPNLELLITSKFSLTRQNK